MFTELLVISEKCCLCKMMEGLADKGLNPRARRFGPILNEAGILSSETLPVPLCYQQQSVLGVT